MKLPDHYTEKDVVLDEMERAGYRLDADLSVSDRQSVLVFVPN